MPSHQKVSGDASGRLKKKVSSAGDKGSIWAIPVNDNHSGSHTALKTSCPFTSHFSSFTWFLHNGKCRGGVCWYTRQDFEVFNLTPAFGTVWPWEVSLRLNVAQWLFRFRFYFLLKSESENCSAMTDSLGSHRLYSPWNSPGQNTGMGSRSLLQGILPTQGSNPHLPHGRQILYQLSHQGSPRILEWVAYPFSSGSSWPRNWTGVSWIFNLYA